MRPCSLFASTAGFRACSLGAFSKRRSSSRLGDALGYLFERVASNEDGGVQATYDLSVPDNVTYVANGMVSHNTIGLMMDCDTTGIEPDLALVKFKKLVGGGSMQIVNQTVSRALKNLGYQPEQAEAISEYIAEHGHVVGAPSLRPEHYEVFDCAMGESAIAPMGHVRMIAAIAAAAQRVGEQDGEHAENATVNDVEEIYFQATWRLRPEGAGHLPGQLQGRAAAFQREAEARAGTGRRRGCPGRRSGCPADSAAARADGAAAEPEGAAAQAGEVPAGREVRPVRRRLPRQRPAMVTRFSVAGAEGYMTASNYPDDGLGGVLLKLGKQGSTLAGVMDAFSIAISVGLQYGIPLESYVAKFTNMRFNRPA